jgi:uncharacterized protein YciI
MASPLLSAATSATSASLHTLFAASYRLMQVQSIMVDFMWIVELSFIASSERLAARPAHRELLSSLREDGRLFAAGPWEDDRGALLIFDVERADLERIMAEDPYYRTIGVEVIRVREWIPFITPSS